MTLKELKKMIAEEYAIYKKEISEQALPDPMVAVSDADVDMEGGEDAEATLKDIYDMLKDYFEKDDKADDKADDKSDDSADDDTDDDKDEITEGHCYGEDGKPMPEGHCYEEDGKLKEGFSKSNPSKILQERFKKLANIIK